MKLARYIGDGIVKITEEREPTMPAGGLVIKTVACGLCSGELMGWYMDQKIPHVLGHEVCGRVVQSEAEQFPIGSRVFAHHHAPCGACEYCLEGQSVHCDTWKTTRLEPGGMAEYFAVSSRHFTDTHLVNDLRPMDAALIEPLACVEKSLRQARWQAGQSVTVIGLGFMGLLHALRMNPSSPVECLELNPSRRDHATQLGLRAMAPEAGTPSDVIIVCPGSDSALQLAVSLVRPGGVILLFSPLPPPGDATLILNKLYFSDVALATSYSAGPADCQSAINFLRSGGLRAEQVVSDFIDIDQLPEYYLAMREGRLLKPMVLFP